MFTTLWFGSLSVGRRSSPLPPLIYPLPPALPQTIPAPVTEPPPSTLGVQNDVGDEAIRAALAGVAVELDESELDEPRRRWPKFALAAVAVVATVALAVFVVRRKPTAVRGVVPAAATNVDTARAATPQVEAVTAQPVPSAATLSPKTNLAKPASGRAVVAAISVGPTKVRIAVARRVTLTVAVIGEDGSNIDGGTVSWTSSRRRVATVSPNGTVTGRRIGTATITARSGGKRSSVVVTVTAREREKSQQP